jgi:hypothetical protein
MDEQKLRKLLEQLQEEIPNVKNVDVKGKELLQEIEVDIRELLRRTETDSTRVHPTILQRFENTIDHLEVTHPSLTNTLSELLEILSNAGI